MAKKKEKAEKVAKSAKEKLPKLVKSELADKKVKAEKASKDVSVHVDEIKRLNRICGQIEGISKMMDTNRKLQDVLVQFKAVHSALAAVEKRVFETYVEQSVDDIIAAEKRKEREAKLEELKQLYKSV